MSTHRARTPSRAPRGRPGSASPPARATTISSDLSLRLSVDGLLAELAAERHAGGAPNAAASAAAEADRRSAAEAEADRRAATSSPAADEPFVTVLPVAGMTCRSCEVRIQRRVGRVPGVTRVQASAARGLVEVESAEAISPSTLARAIEAAGYQLGSNPWLARDSRVWMTALAGLGLVVALAIGAGATGIADLAGGVGDLASGGLVVALLLGLAAGVSTCMALVGGLVLAISASFRAARDAREVPIGAAAQLRPAVVFVAGRVAGYAVLGAVLGAVGASVAMPPLLTAVLMVAVAVLMTILGARLTGVSPRLATWSPTLPLGLGRSLGIDGSTATYSDGRAALLGAASFFLPCGFTQAVQVYALSTGSPALAGAILGVFALGTAPGLLALAGLPAIAPTTARPTLLRLAGVVVLAFAFVNASAGLRLAGITVPGLEDGVAAAAPPAAPVAADGTQALTTFQDAFGYSPETATIYAGAPTRWTIESSTTSTCAVFLVVPALGIQRKLDKGPNVIDLPPMEPGTLSYSCSMGMYGGRITIVEPPSGRAGGGVAGG